MDTLINEPNEHNPGLTDDMIGRLRANYAGSVTLIDDQIAELIAVLKAKGVYEETMIVLTSDHGELNGDFGLLRKQVFLDPAVRIPLVIKPARSQDAARVRGRQDAIIELMDVGPTLAEAAGGDLSFPGNGLSVMPLVRGERDHHRPYAHSAFRNDTMIVTQAFKTVLNERGDVSWMFDRPGDPDEQNNLALKHEAETVAERPASFWRSLFAKA